MRISLNLLPPEKKKSLRQGFVIAFAQSMTLYLFIVVLFLTGTLISVRMTLSNNFKALNQPVSEDLSASSTEIRQINAYLSRIDAYGSRVVIWSDVLKSILGAVPAGVEVDTLSFTSDGSVRMTGLAATRDDLLQLKSKLGSLPLVSDVASPLSNLLQKKDVLFEMTMRYTPIANGANK